MAVKVFDGFDHYAAQQDLQSRVGALQWSDVNSGGESIGLIAGRGGYGRAVSIPSVASNNNPVWFGGSFSTFYTSAFFGLAVEMQAASGNPWFDLHVMDYVNNVAQLTFRFILNSGAVTVYNGDPNNTAGQETASTVIGQSPPNAFSPYLWNYIEVMFDIAASAGTFAVQVNGVTVVSGTGQTNYPATLPDGNPARTDASGFRFRVASATIAGASYAAAIDDFYLCDTTTGPGSYPCNTFLGDTAVRTLYPTANSSVQWTPFANTNYEEVNASQFDGDSTYNYASAAGDTDLFTFGSLPTSVSAVYAVQTTGAYRKQDAGANTIIQEISSSGTTASGSSHVLSLGYGYYTDLFVVDPHTGTTFSPTAVNALVGGYELASV